MSCENVTKYTKFCTFCSEISTISPENVAGNFENRKIENVVFEACNMTGNIFSNFWMKLWTTADPAVPMRTSKYHCRALWSVFQKKLFKNWPHYTYFGIFCMVEISTKQSISQEGRGWWKLFFWDRCIALFYTRTQSILQKNSLPDIFRTIKVARLFLPSTVVFSHPKTNFWN